MFWRLNRGPGQSAASKPPVMPSPNNMGIMVTVPPDLRLHPYLEIFADAI
jgi:hypothetical protein